MANLKISQLPSTSTTTVDDYFVKNNSSETTTNKVKVSDTIGLTKGSGTNSIKSASFLSSTPATSTGIGSVAIGNDSEANADYSTAIGNRAECFDAVRVNSTAIGAFNRVAQYSTAVGNNSQAVGAYDVAIGSNAGASGGNCVAAGRQASAQGVSSVAIGNAATATHTDAVVLGTSQSSVFASTTHMKSAYIADVISFNTATQANLATFTVDLSTDTYFQLTLNQDAVLNFINHRAGALYYIYINNTGSFNFTSVSTAVGTLFFDNGGRSAITHNSKDLWIINAFGNTQLVTQHKNFTT